MPLLQESPEVQCRGCPGAACLLALPSSPHLSLTSHYIPDLQPHQEFLLTLDLLPVPHDP